MCSTYPIFFQLWVKACTSEFRELVSIPTPLFLSTSNVLVPSLAASCLAIASPTAPPPITYPILSIRAAFRRERRRTACVKSASRWADVAKPRPVALAANWVRSTFENMASARLNRHPRENSTDNRLFPIGDLSLVVLELMKRDVSDEIPMSRQQGSARLTTRLRSS